MEKESPVEMRKSLEMVNAFKNAGIGFVPIPVMNEEDRNTLRSLVQEILDKIEEESE